MASTSVSVVMRTRSRHEFYVGVSEVIFIENTLVGHDALHQNAGKLYFQSVLAFLESRVVVNVFVWTPQILLPVVDYVTDNRLLWVF